MSKRSSIAFAAVLGLTALVGGCSSEADLKQKIYQGPPVDRHGPEGFSYSDTRPTYQGPPVDRHGPEGFSYSDTRPSEYKSK